MWVSLSDTKATQELEGQLAEMSFGEWLKQQRRASGWTQKELALQVNCSTSAIRKMESENRRPSAQVVERLAEIFDIPQNERKAFLRFARGDWQAVPRGTDAVLQSLRDSNPPPPSKLSKTIMNFLAWRKQMDFFGSVGNFQMFRKN